MVGIAFTAIVSFEPRDGGTLYRVVAVHGDKATRDQHNDMGFEHGWSAALDQLVELALQW